MRKFLYNLFCLLLFILIFPLSIKAADYRADSVMVKYKGENELVLLKLKNETVEQALRRLRNDPRVSLAEPNYLYRAGLTPSDTNISNQWYLKRIAAFEAWEINYKAEDVVVAVIDSGVQISHPDIRSNLWLNHRETISGTDSDNNGYVDDIHGWDFVNNVNDPSPKFTEGFTEAGITHGTAVAGIIGATGDNSQGVAGLSWQVRLMALKALDDQGNGDTFTVIEALNYAIDHGAHIINLSFVGGGYSQLMVDVLKRAKEKGIIVLAPAGNELINGQGVNLNQNPNYPVCYKDENGEPLVFGVAATNGLDIKTSFSGYGSDCIAISAPGVSFYSTAVYAPERSAAGSFFNQYYDGYWSGTSMAVPVVSGSLALVMGTNPSLSGTEALKILIETADGIDHLNPDYVNQLGSGRINVFQAVLEAYFRLQQSEALLAVAPGAGAEPFITVFDPTGQARLRFLAFAREFKDGVEIAVGDVDGDGEDDIIVAPSGNKEAEIRIFSAQGDFKGNFLALPPTYRGGVSLAIIDRGRFDGKKEIVVAASGPGFAPEVRFFTHDGVMTDAWRAYDDSFNSGISLSVGNIIGLSGEEIVTVPAGGKVAEVKVFSAKGFLHSRFVAERKEEETGWRVAALDVDGSARRFNAEIILSRRAGEPIVTVADFRGIVRQQWRAYREPFSGEVMIGGADLNNNGYLDLIASPPYGGDAHIAFFNNQGNFQGSFYAFEPTFAKGATFAVLLNKEL
ncbi:MAG: S8 family peptidase [Patescibacteria group bacterium]|nr:MAG: S8 family peptidase [Patescibacteria group bacterium]